MIAGDAVAAEFVGTSIARGAEGGTFAVAGGLVVGMAVVGVSETTALVPLPVGRRIWSFDPDCVAVGAVLDEGVGLAEPSERNLGAPPLGGLAVTGAVAAGAAAFSGFATGVKLGLAAGAGA